MVYSYSHHINSTDHKADQDNLGIIFVCSEKWANKSWCNYSKRVDMVTPFECDMQKIEKELTDFWFYVLMITDKQQFMTFCAQFFQWAMCIIYIILYSLITLYLFFQIIQLRLIYGKWNDTQKKPSYFSSLIYLWNMWNFWCKTFWLNTENHNFHLEKKRFFCVKLFGVYLAMVFS